MNGDHPRSQRHEHKIVTEHAVEQRSGVPYEVERRVCTSCRRVLRAQRVRRATA